MRNMLIMLKDFFLGGKQRKPHASNLLIVTSPREPKEVGNNADAKEKECLGKQYKVQLFFKDNICGSIILLTEFRGTPISTSIIL